MFAFINTLSDASLRSAALLALVAVAVPLLLRRSSAAHRHLLWGIALLACIAMPMFSLALPRWEVLPAKALPSPSLLAEEPAAPQPTTEVPVTAETPAAINPISSPIAEPASLRTDSRPLDWQKIITITYALGVAAMLLPIIAGRVLLIPLARSSRSFSHVRPTATPVFTSPRCNMPMTFGILRPRIILPDAAEFWPADRLDAVLAHEQAHIGRFDCLWRTLGQVARALYWFNPLAWYACRRLSIESERACDDAVLQRGATSASYADHLLSIATAGRSDALLAAAAIAMARPTTLEGRLLSILDAARNRQRVTLSIAAAAVILVTAIAIPLATLRAQTPLAAPTDAAQAPASTKPAAVRVVCDVQGNLMSDRKLTDWDSLRTSLQSQSGLAKRYLEVAMVADEKASLGRFRDARQQALARGTQLVEQLKMAYLSDTGDATAEERALLARLVAAGLRNGQDLSSLTPAASGAKLQQWTEGFFASNYRDITARKTLEWGDAVKEADGNWTIRYKYEATIWNKDKIIQDKLFTFAPDGSFVRVKDATASPGAASDPAAPPLKQQSVDKTVSQFPEATDLSTPETAWAAWQRANSRMDAQSVVDLSWVKLSVDEEKKFWDEGLARNPEATKTYTEALANSSLVEVWIDRDELATTICYLPFPEGKGRDPYSLRVFGKIQNQWKNLGEDRYATLEQARQAPRAKRAGFWNQFQQIKAQHSSGRSVPSTGSGEARPAASVENAPASNASLQRLPTAQELPGTLVFHGRYQHRSGGRELGQPSELWVSRQPEGSFLAMAHLPFMQTTEMVVGDAQHRPVTYRSRKAAGEQPGYGMDMQIQDGEVKLTRRGIREDVTGKMLTVPPGAIFDPNSRPDSYCAANILLRQMHPRKSGWDLHAYDWDNTGEKLADYTIRIEFRGSEKVQVPAGNFDANHYVLTQTSTANTWFKKRTGHTTDFWVLDSGAIVRIVRQREPYEMVLLDYDVPKANPTSTSPATAAPTPASPNAAAPPAVPSVVTITPSNMQENVDPAMTELRVVFDQPMDTGGFSWVGGGPAYPQTTGKARWIDDRTCVLPVKLEPGHDYWFSINNSRFTNFRSKTGVAVRPYPVWFQTAASGTRKASGPPKVTKTQPAAGADNVDPNLAEIRVTFDQPMDAQGFSWVTVDENFPKTTGKARWIDDRTCALPVKLEPGREYSLSLNASSFTGFSGKSGVPSLPYPLSFHTSGEAAAAPKVTTAGDRARADELAKEGWVLWNKGDFAAATDRFQEAVTLNPAAANSWNGLGWSFFNSGQRAEAKEAFAKCVELSPKHPAALNGLGQISLLEGDLANAEKQLLAASPTASAAWWGLAKLYLAQEKFDESLKWIDRILKQDPNNADARQLKQAAEAKQVPADLKRQVAPK